jgi:hypothetical protein
VVFKVYAISSFFGAVDVACRCLDVTAGPGHRDRALIQGRWTRRSGSGGTQAGQTQSSARIGHDRDRLGQLQKWSRGGGGYVLADLGLDIEHPLFIGVVTLSKCCTLFVPVPFPVK